MSGMFYGCSSLTKIPKLNWDTSNVMNMHEMFGLNWSLKDISGISNFNTIHVTNICGMFTNCENLSSLPNLIWNTINIKDMGELFCGCKKLTDIKGISKWNTENVENMGAIFSYCEKLSSLKGLQNWNTSKVTSMYSMFEGCCSLSNLSELENWDTGNVSNMKEMFSGCKKLASLLPISNWNIEKAGIAGIFYDCKKNLVIPSNFAKKMNNNH